MTYKISVLLGVGLLLGATTIAQEADVAEGLTDEDLAPSIYIQSCPVYQTTYKYSVAVWPLPVNKNEIVSLRRNLRRYGDAGFKLEKVIPYPNRPSDGKKYRTYIFTKATQICQEN